MKILLVNKFFYRKGGSETYYFALGDALEEQGHEVIWFSMSHPDNLECGQAGYFVENVDYHKQSTLLSKLKNAKSAVYSKEAYSRFEQLLLAERPDIVHINNVHKQITLSILDVCKKYNLPVAATCHDWIYICPNYLKLHDEEICELCQSGEVWNSFKTGCVQNSKLKSLLASFEASFYRRHGSYNLIDLYIAPSKCMTEKMRDARFTDSEIIHMCNFLPTLEVATPPPANPPYFVYMGRLIGEKGVGTLVRAYIKAQLESDLYILGDGPLRNELEETAQQLGAGGRIHFTGTVHGDELARIVGGSRAVVVPSEWLENCPYSVMEALAAGKPVIGSRVGGIPELVSDGETGFCYEMKNVDALAEAMLRMESLSDDEYSRMSARAREQAQSRFSRNTYGSELIRRYEELLVKKGAPLWD